MAWRYVLADSSGVSLGELRATSRSLSVGVSKGAVASCRIRSDDPRWPEVTEQETRLRVYNSAGTLVFYGRVVTDEEDGSGQGATVQINAADLSFEFGRRFYAKDKTGVGVTFAAQDSGDIVYAILAAINAEAPTGITAGTKDAFVTRTVTYLWKRALDALTELGAVQGSYEWALRYTDAVIPVVQLDLRASLGSDRTQAVFLEYGTGLNNCGAYKRVRSRDQQADHVYVLGSGSSLVAEGYDTAAESRYGRFEDVVSYGDIGDAALLDALAAAHVAIRSGPRTLVSLTPFPKTAPRFGVDWAVGDLVTARVKAARRTRVNGVARVWGADISIDELGNEQATLQLEPQT